MLHYHKILLAITTLLLIATSHEILPGSAPFRQSYTILADNGSIAGTITIAVADMLKDPTDAIVNAANTGCLGGGFIDGAIHQAAGPELRKFNQTLPSGEGGRCPVGEARISPAFKFHTSDKTTNIATYIISTTGPQGDDTEHREDLLRSCYRSALDLAAAVKIPAYRAQLLKQQKFLTKNFDLLAESLETDLPDINSISFPLISGGVFGYHAKDSYKVVLKEVINWMKKHPGIVNDIRFYFWSTGQPQSAVDAYDYYEHWLNDYLEKQGRARTAVTVFSRDISILSLVSSPR